MTMSHKYLALYAMLLFAVHLDADELVFDSAAAWANWQHPFGLTETGDEGQLQLVKFRKNINAVEDAHLFSHETREHGDEVFGGIWEVGSNPEDAALAIDGDPQTFWRPDPEAAAEDWFITIDLGRAVLAREIRLTFPDQEGARPLQQFTVLVNTGVRINATRDIFLFRSVYRTTRPNDSTSIVIPLEFPANDSTLIVDAGLPVNPGNRDQYQLIQYVNITAEEQNADGALAEVEVIGIGDNISINTHRRGTITDGFNTNDTANLFDSDLNTNNTISSGSGESGWKDGGVFFGVDLGAVFFVDEMFIYSMRSQEGTLGFGVGWSGPGHTVLFSDGSRALGSSSLPVAKPFDYDELFTHLGPGADRLYYFRYLFAPRRIRYLFWHGIHDDGWGQTKWGEFMIFSPGYPAQVVLRSDFIDLGAGTGDNRPKVISTLSWDADMPVNTRIQLRSRSGNALQQLFTFHDKKGDIVTEEKYNSIPKVLKGPIDTTLVVGEDWDAWSSEYQSSGATFKSQSPRRFVQLELIFATDDPEFAPSVSSLAIEFEEALVQEASGRIEPRETRPNQATRFTYTLATNALPADSGFDRMRFTLSEPVDLQAGIEVQAGGAPIESIAIAALGDSLFIDLPRAITADSLTVSFTTRVLQNASLFALDLGAVERPGLWQSVEAMSRRSNIVLLPELTGSQQLINDLAVDPPTFTPNGDGINDQTEIRFAVLKVAAPEPQVQIFDLTGRLLVQLQPVSEGSSRSYVWDGTDLQGAVAPPGIYLCRIDLGAQTGEDDAVRLISLAY
jgi:hypothetical protein